MIEMLQYGFMQRAFITGILLAVIAPLIGITIVLKRMSMIGDALSHASLAGVALGLLLGINPILGAMGICLFAALGVEAIRRKIPRYSEMAISIIMSTGIGLAGILSGFVKNGTNFNSFLFGSIISISVLVLLCVLLLYKELFYIGFDENAARISGVPVKTINFIFTLLTALTVSIASRTVGTLIVSSMLVIPIACGMQVGRSYKAVMIIGVITALVTTVIGLTLSYYVGLKPGGTIVLLEVVCFLILALISRYTK